MDIAFIPLMAFLVFSPFIEFLGAPINETGWMLTDWQRVLEIVAVSLVLLGAVLSSGRRRAGVFRCPRYQLAGWAAFFSLGALSAIAAAYPKLAGIEWSWSLVCLLTVTYLGSTAAVDRAAAERLLRLLTMSVLLSYTPLFYIGNSDVLFLPPLIWEPSLFGFNNPRVFSDYQSVVVCLLPWAIASSSESKWIRGCAWVVGGAYVALAFVSGSRSIFLGQFVALVAVALVMPRHSVFTFLRGQALLWASAAAFYWLAFVWYPNFAADLPSSSSSLQLLKATLIRTGHSGRMLLWEIAWQLGSTHPLLGIGPMHYATQFNRDAASPHNAVLQVLAEWGAPAAVLFVILLGSWTFARARELAMTSDAGTGSVSCGGALFAGWMAMLAQSLVSPVFNNPHSQVWLIVLAGMLGGYAVVPARASSVVIFRHQVAALGVVAVAVLWILCGPLMARLEERNICYRQALDKPTNHWAPRFWHQGWIFPSCESK